MPPGFCSIFHAAIYTEFTKRQIRQECIIFAIGYMNGKVTNIVLVGSGNVAWHFLNAYRGKDVRFVQMLGRNPASAQLLAGEFSVPLITDPRALNHSADIYILAVQDDQVANVAANLSLEDKLLVHTSGFSGLEPLAAASSRTGVIWPLQTLTTGVSTHYEDIPFIIEANSTEAEAFLASFAGKVSNRVMVAPLPARQKMHLAAVMACNMTNHLYTLASAILEKEHISYSILAPLIRETAEKAARQHPSLNQTGPAARKDFSILRKHLEMLRDEPEWQEIYHLISESIIQLHSKDK